MSDAPTDTDESPHECARCGAPLHIYEDPHLEVNWKEGPPPDRADMAFDDWFATAAYLCPDCHQAFEAFMAGDRES